MQPSDDPVHARLALHQGKTSGSQSSEVRGQKRSTSAPLRSQDRKSTRLNSSHPSISYADFCSKKKKVRSTMTLLPCLLGCLIWLALVAALPRVTARIFAIILLLPFPRLLLGCVRFMMFPSLLW